LLDLAACEETLGDPSAVSIYAMLLAITTDPTIRREARIHQGHVLVLLGNWEDALSALADEDSFPARLDRATALAQLGRTDRALAELAPALAAADTSVRWVGYLGLLASHDSHATDSLLGRLLAFPRLPDARRAAWILATTTPAAMAFDPAAADRRLQRLAVAAGAGAEQARLLRDQLRLTNPATPSDLRGSVDAIAGIDLSDGGFTARHLMDLLRYGRMLLAQNDSTVAGTPHGDLTMFALGELARDSLGAPRLGGWFFARLERQWPQSPYIAKALFARAALEPDSTEVLMRRARAMTSNPYVAAANGDAAGWVQLPRLEDSLGRFIVRLWATQPRSATSSERP
jgi:hypothetical protein